MNDREEGLTSYSMAWCGFSALGLVYMLAAKQYASLWELLVGVSIALTLVSLSIFTDLFVPRGERFFWSVTLASFLAIFILFLGADSSYPTFHQFFFKSVP